MATMGEGGEYIVQLKNDETGIVDNIKLSEITNDELKALRKQQAEAPKTLEDTSGKQTAHADYIYEEIKTFGLDFDTEIEAKAKDLAVIRYRNQFKVLKG